jgi:pantothenate kinase
VQSSLNVKISVLNEARYNKLNKKLEHLRTTKHKHHTDQHNATDNKTFYTRVRNLSNIKFNREELNVLETGLNYVFESQPKHFIRYLIMDTENAIQHLDSSLHNTYRFLTGKRITQIMTSNTVNLLQKRKTHIAKQIRNKLIQHNLMTAKADKGQTFIK